LLENILSLYVDGSSDGWSAPHGRHRKRAAEMRSKKDKLELLEEKESCRANREGGL
jgi:homoserine trans-succinylase